MQKLFAFTPAQIICTTALAVIAVKVTLFLLDMVPPIRIATGG